MSYNNLDKPIDECGVYAVYSARNTGLAHEIYYGLYALQHRGQESAGIAVSYGNKIAFHKDVGLVNDVFSGDVLSALPEGDIAIGHVRAPSEGEITVVSSQPIVYNGKCGMFALAMNGKVTNAQSLRGKLIAEGIIFQSDTDVEIIANLINKYYDEADIAKGIKKALEILEGSYALVIMTANKLIAARDRFALRPLSLGKKFDDYYITSETCAFDACSVDYIKDIAAGEILTVDSKGLSSIYLNKVEHRACIFEFVYTARADSVIDSKSVYEARFNCGKKMAEKIKIDADIVAGVPDSAVVAARGYAAGSGLPYVDVLEKNRYVGRTFIQPSQFMRENSVKIKLNPHRANIKGKRVVLIDDSIVRGTTSRKLVELLKNSGAAEVHMLIASPTVEHPCYTGVDIETYDELIAANYSVETIRDMLGADSLHFMAVEDLKECCGGGVGGFCSACFDGDYPDNIEEKVSGKRE